MIREFLELFIIIRAFVGAVREPPLRQGNVIYAPINKFGYYYGRKLGGGEGQAARPQRLSCRVAIKPVAQAFQPVAAPVKRA
jgi:hypothetical protein